jgi:hypothetical protein
MTTAKSELTRLTQEIVELRASLAWLIEIGNPTRPTCNGTTVKGTPCTRYPLAGTGTGFCKLHGPQEDPE